MSFHSGFYWYILSEYDGFGNFMCRFDEYSIVFIFFRVVYSYRLFEFVCLPAWLISPLPVRAARQRVGCEYAGNQFAFRMMLLFLARTYDCALALGMLAQAQWLYQVCCMRLRCTEICLYESYASIKTASYTGYSNAFSIDAIVRVPHGQGSKPHPSTVLLHHLARGIYFTGGPTSGPCHSP